MSLVGSLATLAPTAAQVLAVDVPNPDPTAPPGLSTAVNTLLGWLKWGGLVAGVAGSFAVTEYAKRAAPPQPTQDETAPAA